MVDGTPGARAGPAPGVLVYASSKVKCGAAAAGDRLVRVDRRNRERAGSEPALERGRRSARACPARGDGVVAEDERP